MTAIERQTHWQNVYQTKGERNVSWFQEMPTISLDLIRATGAGPDAAVIDVGGGASRLVDGLIAEGFHSLSVLDVSEKALATSRERLGPEAANVTWIVADITAWQPGKRYDVWHIFGVCETGCRPILQFAIALRHFFGDDRCEIDLLFVLLKRTLFHHR